MTRGGDNHLRVHYKGKDEDLIVFLDSVDDFRKWKDDKSTPLTQVVSSFKVFTTNRHGAQGYLEGASNGTLENEFDTTDETEIIRRILEEGTLQETQLRGRAGNSNMTNGSFVSHN